MKGEGEREPVGISHMERRIDLGGRLTNDSWTAPQKHVAVASFSLDHPSLAELARGIYGLDLLAAETEAKAMTL